jgi:hypothetical protein
MPDIEGAARMRGAGDVVCDRFGLLGTQEQQKRELFRHA